MRLWFQTLASLGPANPKYWHLFVEAKKLAFNDLYAFNGDPNFSKVPLERLLSKAHAESLCGKVDPNRASNTKAGGNAEIGLAGMSRGSNGSRRGVQRMPTAVSGSRKSSVRVRYHLLVA